MEEKMASRAAENKRQDEHKEVKKVVITKTMKKQKKRDNDWDEWEQLQKEECLVKKLKRGKITKE